jgi:hypothetical protein
MSANRSDPGQGSGPARYPGTFLLAVREALASLNWEIRRLSGGTVQCADAQGREQTIGLENIYRRARREDRSTWPQLIAGFLGSVPGEQLDNPPTDLAAVADRLLVRLGPPLDRNGELKIWFQPLVEPDLGLSLVIDYPQSMSYVTEQMMADSGRPGNTWLDRALENLSAQTPADCFQVLHEESGLRCCTVGDAYDSSRAMLLDRLLPDTAADGCLVAVPGRDELLVLPLCAAGLAQIPALKAIAEKSYRSAPYSISEDIYWVRGGHWFLFPVGIKGDNFTVSPPPDFLEVLQRIAPMEKDGQEESGVG